MKNLMECVPDFEVTEKFLTKLEPDTPHTFQVFYEKDKNKKLKNTKSPPPELIHGYFDEVKDELYQKNQEGYIICVLINKGDKEGRKKENILEVRALFLDLDGSSPELVKMASLKPHMVIESSPEKFHVYWLVAGCPLDRFSDLQRAIAKKFDGDPKVCDLPRVMRVPGSIHWKDEPFVSKLLKLRDDLPPYTVEQVINGLDLELEIKTVCSDTKKSSKNAIKSAIKPTVESIKKALGYIPADDREIWLRTGMAIHDFDNGPLGYNLWTTWSALSQKFDEKTQQMSWNGFTQERGISIGTLFYLAKRYGATESFGVQPEYSTNYQHTDLGNSEFLVSRVAGDLYVVLETGHIIVWNGLRWVSDKFQLNTEAIATVKAIGQAAKQCQDDTMRATLQRHAHLSQAKCKIDAMIGLAKQNPRLVISQDKLNSDPFLLGVQNGVVDLRTGESRLEAQEDLITQYSSVHFDPEAKCPLFESFVAEIMDNDPAMIVYLQKVVGYSLTGSIKEHCMFMLIGDGRNGKSLLIRILQTLLGYYAVQIPSTCLMESKFVSNGPTPELAVLPGKRLAAVSEVGEKQTLNQVLVKHLTGGDKISARALYKEQFEFNPMFKIWMTGNSKPAITSDDDSIWRRLHIIPFKRKFLGKNQDKDLYDKLIAELPGILNWCIQGCLLWQTQGLITPMASKLAIQEYRGQMDTVGQWVDSCCIKEDSFKLPAAIAYNSYLGWCSQNKLKPHSSVKFGKVLGKIIMKTRTGKGKIYVGIKLNAEGVKMTDVALELEVQS